MTRRGAGNVRRRREHIVIDFDRDGRPQRVHAHHDAAQVPGPDDDAPHGCQWPLIDRYGLADLPDKATSLAIATPWRPYASVASWYCWRSLDLARNTETVAKGYPS